VTERIRRPIPAGLSVLPGTLPIVSFGDPSVAAVATLSLNPSWIEFEAPRGGWLDGARRRVASDGRQPALDPLPFHRGPPRRGIQLAPMSSADQPQIVWCCWGTWLHCLRAQLAPLRGFAGKGLIWRAVFAGKQRLRGENPTKFLVCREKPGISPGADRALEL
jgi:hypothetical protein